jgi:hypothetical protein
MHETLDERQAADSRAEEGSSSTERALRKKLSEVGFPLVVAVDQNSAQWMDETLEHPERGSLPVGKQRADLGQLALGSLVTAKRILELDLTLRYGLPVTKGSSGGGGSRMSAASGELAGLEAILKAAPQKAASNGRKRKAPPVSIS